MIGIGLCMVKVVFQVVIQEHCTRIAFELLYIGYIRMIHKIFILLICK